MTDETKPEVDEQAAIKAVPFSFVSVTTHNKKGELVRMDTPDVQAESNATVDPDWTFDLFILGEKGERIPVNQPARPEPVAEVNPKAPRKAPTKRTAHKAKRSGSRLRAVK